MNGIEKTGTLFLFKHSRRLEVLLFGLLMVMGIGVRLLDLTDLPFDLQPPVSFTR